MYLYAGAPQKLMQYLELDYLDNYYIFINTSQI